jgi:O-succinylbenzoic acid--CoA ligase
VRGTAEEILDLLRSWDAADEPQPVVVETSGSTGRPKRVVLSRQAMRASVDATHARLGGPGQWLLALPATYVAGLLVLFRSVRAGTEPVVAADGLAAGAARTMTGERRYLSLVPTQLHRALGDDRVRPALTRFDSVLVGGAPLDPGLRRRAEESGARIVATYGSSETCGGCVYDGSPLDGVEVGTVDGRVRVRGPVLFDGYDGQPDLTAQVLRDGWFLTQDLGEVGEDGRLRLHGRADDVILSGGVNVPVGAVGAALRSHPEVRELELVCVPDEEWGESLVAVADTDLGIGELRDRVAEHLPRSFAPRRLVRVAALPLLPNGKVDRLAVRRLADRAPR